MRNVMRVSVEDVVKGHDSNLMDGLSIPAIASLRRIHGLNKLEAEEKVRYDTVIDETHSLNNPNLNHFIIIIYQSESPFIHFCFYF
jgi:hypothetical protein